MLTLTGRIGLKLPSVFHFTRSFTDPIYNTEEMVFCFLFLVVKKPIPTPDRSPKLMILFSQVDPEVYGWTRLLKNTKSI